MISRRKALKIRSLAMGAAAEMDDISASSVPELFPRLKQDGALVTAGTRICWQGQLKKAASDLWDTRENDPDHAPTLWEDIDYVDGIRVIPETITVTTAFSRGEKGLWKGKVYQSVFDGQNVWNPEQFPAGWECEI